MQTKGQIEAARHAVLAIAGLRSAMVVTGSDRIRWLNGLVTCDLAKRHTDEATYGLVVARNGRVLSDVVVFLDGARLLLAVPPSEGDRVKAHLEHYLITEDVEITQGADAFDVWELHGPRSAALLARARLAGATGALLDRTGLGGAILFASQEGAKEVRSRIEDALIELGGVVGDLAAWSALRLERGVAAYKEDFDETTYPQEAGLEKVAVSFDKGCYLGQEVVCMLEMRGHVNRRLTALVLEAREVPQRGTVVTDLAGTGVGMVTSAALSPTLGRPIALAMVKRTASELSSQLLVGGARAEVVAEPV